jgi:transcriptional regulator with XRE-family HTH domain
MNGATQEDIAAKLGVDASTVSRNLRRGYYWQMQETSDRIPALLASDRTGMIGRIDPITREYTK